jgi:hypothetical protein
MEHEEFVKAYVNDEWLSWEDATALAIQRDEDAKEQFLADIFPEDYRPEYDDLYDRNCYGL